jgi:hypothetical protein
MLRQFITRREAHSALSAQAPATPNARGVVLSSTSTKAADKSCVRDTAYEKTAGIGLTRCVYYLRTIDVLVVQDVVTASQDTANVLQRWVLPPDVNAVEGQDSGGLRLSGTTANGKQRTARMLTSLEPFVEAAGPVLGQFGTKYGVQTPGTVISSPITVESGATQRALTAIAPGDRPITMVDRTTANGRPALTVKAGNQRQTIVLSL